MSTAVYEGGCLCGAVRYRAQGPATGVEYCHCSMCRKAGGAPVVVWAAFPTAAVAFTQGEPTRYASSERGRRGFCARCGSTLTFQWADRPEQIDLSVGTLDDPALLAPQWHIYEADRIPWLHIADDLPRHPAARPK